MASCSGIKADGGRCGAQAIRAEEHCINHHPEYEATRRRRGSKGGKAGGRGRMAPATSELDRLRAAFEGLAEEVREGRLEGKTAAIIGQLLNYGRACLRDRVAAAEQEELVSRLEALEQAAEEAKRYGT